MLSSHLSISHHGDPVSVLYFLAHQLDSPAEIALVISNVPGVKGLERAAAADIPAIVINHKNFKSREEFEDAIHAALVAASIDLVCLAGFMRILTSHLVDKWRGKILNTHPALLPSFKG